MENNYDYQMPQNYSAYDKTSEVMSVGQYIGMFILSAIPVVNLICWIVWLVSPNTNKNKKNFIIAQIVLAVIGIVLAFVLSAVTGFSVMSILNNVN